MAKSPEQVRAEAEITEYSTYRATAPIVFDGEIAYRPGHAVPVSNVELHKYDELGLVEKVRGEEKTQAAAASPNVVK